MENAEALEIQTPDDDEVCLHFVNLRHSSHRNAIVVASFIKQQPSMGTRSPIAQKRV